MKINCIAVDDEPLALEIIKDYCAKIPFLNMLQVFTNAIDTMEYLRNNSIDLILLDIQMEDLTGLQLLSTLNVKPYVIMTTAYDKYALQGFDLDVTDYLLKPISFERFLKGINKVYDRMQKETNIPAGKPIAAYPSDVAERDYFFVKTDTHIEKVTASEVLYVEGMGDYWRIVTKNKRIMTLMNAHGMEDVLPENKFCRVHRSYFVALNKIESVERRHIKIADQRIPIGDTYQKSFFDIIEKKK